ncbi:DUF1524 domain-containing protein (plasmid) [Arthrobacter sp. TES]|nr:deoxyribonuclease [Arthrobacter sp. AK-YN10]QOI65923.1 DUF1524 domain-containing protein [Arthrobacter sp. TES]
MSRPTYRLLSATAAFLVMLGIAGCETEAVNAAPATETPSSVASPQPVEKSAPTTQAAEPSETAASKTPEPAQKPQAAAGTALEQLQTIPVKGRAPKTGYDRDLFGAGWKDPDRNGCDARNDMLNRDLTDTAHKPGTQGCVVTTGTLADPFTATTIDFIRGNATSTAVQIDHVVALSDAWQKGAQQLAPNQREAFANDPLNLLATDGPTNAAKGDSDAATWLPPNKAFRCEYVALQTAVKAKHELWMTQAEHTAIRNILETSCPRQPVPEDTGGVSVPVAAAPAPAPKPKPAAPAEVAPAPAPAPDAGVFYQNCSAVRAAGAAPIRVGDPGWESKFDRDGDGVGCE